MDQGLDRALIIDQYGALLAQTFFLSICTLSVYLVLNHTSLSFPSWGSLPSTHRILGLVILVCIWITHILILIPFFLDASASTDLPRCTAILLASTILRHIAFLLVALLTALQSWGRGKTSLIWRWVVFLPALGYTLSMALGYGLQREEGTTAWGGCWVQEDESSALSRGISGTLTTAALVGQGIHQLRLPHPPRLLQPGLDEPPSTYDVEWRVPWHQKKHRPTGYASLLLLAALSTLLQAISCGFPLWEHNLYFSGVLLTLEALFIAYDVISLDTTWKRQRVLEGVITLEQAKR